jgi:glycosyltransferase involved in cell wall biosynthesis
VKLAVVVQRYGADISGGAELHARYVAEHLSRHVEVEVVTTCATDYIRWRNELAPGSDVVNGIPVLRFPVRRERDPEDFGRRSTRVFEQRHSIRDELQWLDSEGPTTPALVAHLRRTASAYDFIVFFSYRYYHAYHGIRTTADRAMLVPTAERDPALGLATSTRTFRSVRALMYNSHEEQALIQAVARNEHVPGVVVGVGSEIRDDASAARFRERTGIAGCFVLYVGRIDENKGCRELFDYFQRYAAEVSDRMQLVLVGAAVMEIPAHPRIRHLGFVTDEEKYDALAAADALLMPSYYESLSMVTLEAWALRLPVLTNGRCDVLRGQVIRANAGLYYESYEEFAAALRLLEAERGLRQVLGANGRAYFERHYTWSVVERKYLAMLERLERANRDGEQPRVEPEPGWLHRRRRVQAPAREIVDRLPTGPAARRWEAEEPEGVRPAGDGRDRR